MCGTSIDIMKAKTFFSPLSPLKKLPAIIYLIHLRAIF